MPQVLVNIGGRPYRLACNPGEEAHLEQLAQYVEGKIEEMRGSFRDIGDQRIVVMAALSVVDELFETRRKAEARVGESAVGLARESAARAAADARAAELADALEEATLRVETLTETLGARTEE